MSANWLGVGVCMLAGASLLGASTIQVERTNTQNYPDEVQIKSVPVEGAGLMRLGGLLFCGAGLAIAQPLLTQKEESQQTEQAVATAPQREIVAEPEVKPTKAKQTGDRYAGKYGWIKDLFEEGSIFLCGPRGSGKTSKAEFLIEEYIKRGYRVEVADPHAKAGQWAPLKVYGRGFNYAEVEQALRDYIDEIKERYQRLAEDEDYDPLEDEDRCILVCEEMIKWASKLPEELVGEFLDVAVADIRKANGGVVFISQGETLACIGGKAAAGKKALLDDSLAKLKGMSVADPSVKGGYRPLPYAEWKPSGARVVKVAVPDWMRGTPKAKKPKARNNVVAIRPEQEAIAQSQPTELEDPWSTTA
jgi:hypothetical protein